MDDKEAIDKRIGELTALLKELRATRSRLRHARGPTARDRAVKWAALVVEELREAGGPLRQIEIVRRLGAKFRAPQSLHSQVGATLCRRPDLFVRVRHGTYDLAPGRRDGD